MEDGKDVVKNFTYYNSLPKIKQEEESLFTYYLSKPSPMDYVREENRQHIINEHNHIILSAIMFKEERSPIRSRLQEQTRQDKRRMILNNISSNRAFNKLNAEQYKLAIHLLFTVLDLDEVDVPLHPEPRDKDLDDIVREESPITQIQTQLNALLDTLVVIPRIYTR